MMEKQSELDIETYYEISKPFESEEAADTAIKGFFQAVREARAKFKIGNVLVVVKSDIRMTEGTRAAMSWAHNGDELWASPMAAWALGQAQKEYRDLVGKMIRE